VSYYEQAGWAPDCGAAKLIKKDEDCMDENGAILKGPDDVVCEVGGSGPDTDGYYYSAAFMATVRTSCPMSCGTLGYNDLVGPLCPATCGKCDDWCTDQDSMMALWATQNPGWPETCAAVPKDVEDWKDEWGYDCAAWAADCNVAKMNTAADCVSPHNHAEQIVGADGQACEAGGFGPDAGLNYYSAATMAAIRDACPASCDPAIVSDGIYWVACGASSDKCEPGSRRSLSAAALKALKSSGSFKIKK